MTAISAESEPLNIPNILRLAEYLETLPKEEFNMNNWCGTACCIAGHASKLFPSSYGRSITTKRHACEALGLTYNFSIENDDYPDVALFTPSVSEIGALSFDYTNIHPLHAARVLRHLAATRTVDWSVALADETANTEPF